MVSYWLNLSNPPIQSISGKSRYYVLIDAAQVARFSRTIKFKTPSVLGRVALFGEVIAPDRYDATPHLFEIEEPSNYATFVRQLSKTGATHGAITCLVSPLDLPELATRLKCRLDAKLPDGVDCVNRFFDGRISPHLYTCLNEEQRAVFFSVGEQWVVVGHDYEWQRLECRFSAEDHFSAPLVFTAKQETYLIDRCYPYALIEHFEQTDADLLDAVQPRQRYQFFQKAIADAENYGLIGASEITLFCTLCMTRGANFHVQAPWPERLKAVRTEKITLQEAVKAFHD